jgi:hypothetical protein
MTMYTNHLTRRERGDAEFFSKQQVSTLGLGLRCRRNFLVSILPSHTVYLQCDDFGLTRAQGD